MPGHPDALVRVNGLGAPRWAERAPFSTRGGRCLDAHAPRVLRHWAKGRRVTVTIRTGNGGDGDQSTTQRVRVRAVQPRRLRAGVRDDGARMLLAGAVGRG